MPVQRPADAVGDQARLCVWHLPDFLDAQPIGLRRGVGLKAIDAHEVFGEGAAATFGQQGILRAHLHAGLVVGFRMAVARAAHFARPHAVHGFVFDDDIHRREAGKNIDAQGFRLFAQPAA